MIRLVLTGWSARALLAMTLVLGACTDPVLDDRRLEIVARGTVVGVAYLDLDGNSIRATGESTGGVEVWLATGGGGYAARATTDSTGVFVLDSVPVGNYKLRVNPATLPSGALVAAGDSTNVLLVAGDTTTFAVRLTYPTVALSDVRSLPPGRHVVTHGIALNARIPFGDAVVHLQSGSTYLRATDVERLSFSPGDSLRLLGTTAVSEGQPVLTDVRPYLLLTQVVLVRPLDVRGDEAASAKGGTLDAALVRVRNAVVFDTVPSGPDLLLSVHDGTGPLEVMLRDFLSFPRATFEPDSVYLSEATGLLVPVQDGAGVVHWRLTPRGTSDVVVRPIPRTAPTP